MPEPVIAEPLCSVEYCPAPNDPDWHYCLHCGSPNIEHHHVEGRGANRMKKESVVALCRDFHQEISLNKWKDVLVYDPEGVPMRYAVMDMQSETVFETAISGALEAESPLAAISVTKGPSPDHDLGWRASQLVSFPDWQLVQQFNEFYGAAGVLKMEAYRRVDAYRLKYAGVAGERWTDKAETDFEMPAKTLRHYSRAWQAFEQALDQTDVPDELKDAFQKMGGGVWQVIGRMPEATWPQMSEIALSVAANTGVGRGMAARVAAKGQEEGLLAKSDVKLKCPNCGWEDRKAKFEKVSDE